MYALHSKAIIPIEMEAVTDKTCENDDDITDSRMEMYVKKMNTFRDAIYADAKESIVNLSKNRKESMMKSVES